MLGVERVTSYTKVNLGPSTLSYSLFLFQRRCVGSTQRRSLRRTARQNG